MTSVEVVIRAENIRSMLLRIDGRTHTSVERKRELEQAMEFYETRCYYTGNEECLEKVDKLFLQRQEVRRKHEVQARDEFHECVMGLPVHLRGLEFYKSAQNMTDIRAAERYVHCHEKHQKLMLRINNEEFRVVGQGLRDIKEQYGIS